MTARNLTPPGAGVRASQWSPIAKPAFSGAKGCKDRHWKRQRPLTKRFAQVVEHYDFESSRIEPGEAHQNGVAEKANDLLKTTLVQALILRGSRDFATVEISAAPRAPGAPSLDQRERQRPLAVGRRARVVRHRAERYGITSAACERTLLIAMLSTNTPQL